MNYKITKVSETVRDYDTKFGAMKSYKVMLENETDPVEISQKASTPAPEAGQELSGSIQTTDYGKKFKKEFANGGFTGGSGGNKTESPEKQDSIMKMNALNNAVNIGSNHKWEGTSTILATADEFLDWLRSGKSTETPVGKPVDKELQTGYEKAKANWGKEEPPIESFDADEINLDEIPF